MAKARTKTATPAAKQPAKTKQRTTTAKIANCIVLFGLDENGKCRAAKFPSDDEAAVNKLALARGLRVGLAHGSKHAGILSKLPDGHLYSTGNSSVPLVGVRLYESLNTLVGGEPGQISYALPSSREEVAPGHLVIAQASIADGWWEAVVTRRDGNTLCLKWRDEPGVEILRDIEAVALLDSGRAKSAATPSAQG
jgi:hypothetical protein